MQRHIGIQVTGAILCSVLLLMGDSRVWATGSVTTEGYELLNVAEAQEGVHTGDGVRVGVIADGIVNAAVAINSGDLPLIMSPGGASGNGNMGTAMLEIIHDLAPDAELFFAPASTATEMITALNALNSPEFDCDIIVTAGPLYGTRTDRGEPFFRDQTQNGTVAALAQSLSSSRLIIAAAGDDGSRHHQKPFSGIEANFAAFLRGGVGPTFEDIHDFKATSDTESVPRWIIQNIPSGATVRVVLQWSDPWGTSANDYSLFLCNGIGSSPNCGNDGSHPEWNGNVTQDGVGNNDFPIEVVEFTNEGSTPNIGVIVAPTFTASQNVSVELFVEVVGGLDPSAVTVNRRRETDSIVGHAIVPGVVSVTTVNWDDPGLDMIAAYSARGPASTGIGGTLTTRSVPLLAALDKVSVTPAGGFPNNQFKSTAAAAAHVAGIAAILKSKDPRLTPMQMRGVLQAGAVHPTLPAGQRDDLLGYGILDAAEAAALVTDCTADDDLDGVLNCDDGCPNNPLRVAPGPCINTSDANNGPGCVGNPANDLVNTDMDGAIDCLDGCPNNPQRTVPGPCINTSDANNGPGCVGNPAGDSFDGDSDGTVECLDICPGVPNPEQNDNDMDGFGNECDNCIGIANPTQADFDLDGEGDACDDCTDSDMDGFGDPEFENAPTTTCATDLCPSDPGKSQPGICGCGVADTDMDNDDTVDCFDLCPTDPTKTAPGICGCNAAADAEMDPDMDGTPNCIDDCPNNTQRTTFGPCGDGCTGAPGSVEAGEGDADGDDTIDCLDDCPDDPDKTSPGVCGCGEPDDLTDTDMDFVPDCFDACPNDPHKFFDGGICGCGVLDTDMDMDGVPSCGGTFDLCDSDPNKLAPGLCGCGVADTDSDGDGTPNCNDGCPNDAGKVVPGICGCGVAENVGDADGDGTVNCLDGCANDPGKTAPGTCGCGTSDTDSDGDGTPDCNDACPLDAGKLAPGACGCGTSDADSDGEGIPDCQDNCPNVPNPDQADGDGNGVGDACQSSDGTGAAQPPICGFGAANASLVSLTVLGLVRLIARRRRALPFSR